MEIEVKSQTDDEIVFIVRDAEVPFINAIRRCAMVNVPKIAIEDVNELEELMGSKYVQSNTRKIYLMRYLLIGLV